MPTIPYPIDLSHDFQGPVKFRQAPTGLGRTSLNQEDLTRFPIPLTSLRLATAYQTPLTGTASGSDLAITTVTTWGTDAPYVTGGDCKGNGTLNSITRRLAFEFQLPFNYVAGETVSIVANASFKTTLPDGAATILFEAYKSGRNTLISGINLVSTAATSIKDLGVGVFGERSFNVTPTSLSPGDIIFVRCTVTSIDTAATTAVIPAISDIAILCDTKG